MIQVSFNAFLSFLTRLAAIKKSFYSYVFKFIFAAKMKRRSIYIFIALTVLAVSIISCSEYQKLLKSDDYEQKLIKAREYYEKGDYYRSTTLLDDLGNVFRGRSEAEEIHYLQGKCYFGNGEYSLAAYYFKTFSEIFPLSNKVEECDFMAAYCFFLLAPSSSLDQSYTLRGIQELQLFMDRHPKSELRDTVNILVDQLFFRMETKAFNNAKMYHDIGDYKAAIIALKNVLNDYPDTKYREQAMFYITRSAYLLAQSSVEEKKKQRYKDTVEYYLAFIDRFPESRFVREAEKIYSQSLKYIN